MRRQLRVLAFVAAASIAVGLVAAGAGPDHAGVALGGTRSGSAVVTTVLAGPDAFGAVLQREANHLASVAPAEQAGSARLLLLLASSLCALGLFERAGLRGRAHRSPAHPSRPRAHQGVGLRAPPPSPVVA